MSFATLNFDAILADAQTQLGHKLAMWLETVEGVAVEGEPMKTTAEWVKSALMVKVEVEAAIGERQLAWKHALVSNDAYKQLPARTLIRDRVDFIRHFLEAKALETPTTTPATVTQILPRSSTQAITSGSVGEKRPLESEGSPSADTRAKRINHGYAPPAQLSFTTPHINPRPSTSRFSYASRQSTPSSPTKSGFPIKHPSPWGQRCCICGHTGNDHTSRACPNSSLQCGHDIPVLCEWQNNQGERQKFVVKRPHPQAGTEICPYFNFYRYTNALCDKPGSCKYLHACSLCLDPTHRAIDCDKHRYLPQLTSRPSDLPPMNVQMALSKGSLLLPRAPIASSPSTATTRNGLSPGEKTEECHRPL